MHSFNALAAGDVYGAEYGTGYFYEQSFPQQAFDARLEYIMNHVNSKLGKPWKELNDYIFAFEAENEAMIGKVRINTPARHLDTDVSAWFRANPTLRIINNGTINFIKVYR